VGLLLAPSSDWSEITPIYGHMAAYRAVEGFVPASPSGGGRGCQVPEFITVPSKY
jgi:hypothetical protein